MTTDRQREQRPSGRMPFSIISPLIQSVMIVIVAIGMSILWWLPLRIIGESVRAQELDNNLGELARHFLDHPWHIQFLTVPAVVAGVVVFFLKRGPGRIFVVAIAWLLELIPLAAIIYVFFSFLAPLYTYQDL